jgi:hypothetical protein
VKLLTAICLATAITLTGCAAWLPIAQDVAAIVQDVTRDVMAGKPFATVLADTGSDDAALLVAIITAIEGSPKTGPQVRALYATKCQPYLDAAVALAARQKAAREGSP